MWTTLKFLPWIVFYWTLFNTITNTGMQDIFKCTSIINITKTTLGVSTLFWGKLLYTKQKLTIVTCPSMMRLQSVLSIIPCGPPPQSLLWVATSHMTDDVRSTFTESSKAFTIFFFWRILYCPEGHIIIEIRSLATRADSCVHPQRWGRFIQMTQELLMFDVLSDHDKYDLLIG